MCVPETGPLQPNTNGGVRVPPLAPVIVRVTEPVAVQLIGCCTCTLTCSSQPHPQHCAVSWFGSIATKTNTATAKAVRNCWLKNRINLICFCLAALIMRKQNSLSSWCLPVSQRLFSHQTDWCLWENWQDITQMYFLDSENIRIIVNHCSGTLPETSILQMQERIWKKTIGMLTDTNIPIPQIFVCCFFGLSAYRTDSHSSA